MTTGDAVIGYVRVSTAEQSENGASLDAQRAAIERECERRGWMLLRVERDVQSGKSIRKRPGLERAREALRSGEASALVAAKLDRLSRSVLDFAEIVEEARSEGYGVVVVDQGFDLETPHGRAMANMLATFARYEREIIQDRIKTVLALKKAQGVKLGRPQVLAPELRKRMRRQRAQGWSYAKIARQLNEQGVPTAHGGAKWYSQTVKAAIGA